MILTRPLVVLDVETHDKCQPEDARICELGFLKIFHDEREPRRWRGHINPRLPISVGATAVHGITDEIVAAAPSFDRIAANLALGFSDCDFCGYNVNYDLRVMAAEMSRNNVAWSYANAFILDPFRLWQVKESRKLEDAVRRWLHREPQQAHHALEDAEDAYDVLLAQLHEWQDVPNTPAELHKLLWPDRIDPEGKFRFVDGVATVMFGKKYMNVPMKDVPPDFYAWMLRESFGPGTRAVAERALKGEFPTP